MLRRTFASWRAHFTRRFGVPLALLGLVTGFSPLISAVPAQAGTMQNYIVLYSGSAGPANAAASVPQAGGTPVHTYHHIGRAGAPAGTCASRRKHVEDTR